jgi:hypothetical protein
MSPQTLSSEEIDAILQCMVHPSDSECITIEKNTSVSLDRLYNKLVSIKEEVYASSNTVTFYIPKTTEAIMM